ncbi:MAG: GtrA family protein [Candidatus Nanopelagicales bacterium]
MEPAALEAEVPTPVSREIVPFIAVGVFAVGVDFALFNLFLWWQWPVWLANGAALLVSMSVAFVGNYKWTFSHREIKSLGHAYGTFTIINLAAVAFIEVTVVAVHVAWDADDLWLNIVKAIATGLATLGRFFAYKRWVFF